MSPQQEQSFTELLSTFDAYSLGEGDINAGGNTLAAMICTLANLAHPSSGIRTASGKLIKVGNDLLVSGSFSKSLIDDTVIARVREHQNNISSHVSRTSEDLKQSAINLGGNFDDYPKGQSMAPSKNPMLGIYQTETPPLGSGDDQWLPILYSVPHPHFQDLVKHPKIIVSASTPADLQKQLSGSHSGCPLILMGLRKSAGDKSFGDLVSAVMDGTLPDGIGGKTIKGRLLITDGGDVLPELATPDASWLGRLIWLVDGDAGPVISTDEKDQTAQGRQSNIHRLFERALSRAFCRRLNLHDSPMTIHSIDLDAAQIRWVNFLKTLEDSSPGISGTARNLLATLVFGIAEIIPEIVTRKGFKNSCSGIEAFSIFIIQRMSNAHQAMIHSERDKRLLKLHQSMLRKLNDTWQSPGQLVRRFNRLPTADCREVLHNLEAQGAIISKDDKYALCSSVSQIRPTMTLSI